MLSKVVALTLAASAVAQSISIVRPNGDKEWWVAESLNTLQWSPCDTSIQGSIPAFNVVVMNSNQQVLAGNLSILGNEPTFECSKTITPALTPGTGYTIMLTNAINTNQVYTSANFEVKAKGSPYPDPGSLSSSSSASASGTASGSSPSQSGSGSSGAGALVVSIKTLFGTVLGAGALSALL